MIIQKKRIRNISPYIRNIKDGSKIIVGFTDIARVSPVLKRIGFSEPYKKGQAILPAGVGPISKYNAEGKEIIHREQPMETAYAQVDWKWQEWDGTWHSKISDRSYQRYPRSFVGPPAMELSIMEGKDEQFLLISPIFKKTEENKETLTHAINLFLEIFGECQFFTEDLDMLAKTPLHRLNWTILPQGEMPWEKFKKEIEPIIKSAPKGNQEVLYYRLETVNSLKPDFRAIGNGGFHGYIVHGFTKNNIYVLESMYYGNATYVFDCAWKELSQRTKAEILQERLHKVRIIHREGWKKRVEEVIRENKN